MRMRVVRSKIFSHGKLITYGLLLTIALVAPFTAYGGKKKKDDAAAQPEAAKPIKPNDFSHLVWPQPPEIPRVRYMDYFAGMKIDRTQAVATKKKKQSWMDRMAGTPEKAEQNEKLLKDFPYQLLGPYGVGVDSKGLVYVADQKVGAVFIFNPETKDVQLIKNGADAHFVWINGIALDDNDRLFVSDGKAGHVLVFNAEHKLEGSFKEGMVDPNGLAIDTENRRLYVVDTQQDQVLVYDPDTYQLLKKIGGTGKKHTLTTPGDFAAPTNAAVDAEGNLYVTDTLNDRVEIFDAGGNFISTFGKNCDAPGCFERPKGIAIDTDGHIWVADAMTDRLQLFTREGELVGMIGGHGNQPSRFSDLVGLTYDKVRHRMYTTEQYPGRMQAFIYITDEEANAEKQKGQEERKKKHEAAGSSAAADKAPAAVKPVAPNAQGAAAK